jgi:hypothetical protein
MVLITRPTNVYSIQMPTPDEMDALLRISRSCLFPKAPPLSDRDGQEFFTSFSVAFSYISTLRRSAELKDRADLWISRCGNWAHERHSGEHVDIGLSEFLCAIAASGDTDYRYVPEEWPFNIFVGLSWIEGPAATAAGWQGVISSGNIRASIPAPRSPYPQPAPRIVDMAHAARERGPFEG